MTRVVWLVVHPDVSHDPSLRADRTSRQTVCRPHPPQPAGYPPRPGAGQDQQAHGLQDPTHPKAGGQDQQAHGCRTPDGARLDWRLALPRSG